MRWEEEEVAGWKGYLLWGNLSLLGQDESRISALQGHRVSLKGAAALLPDTHLPATQVPRGRRYCGCIWESRTVFCRVCKVHSPPQGRSKLTKYLTSSTCHSSELLQQTITWFLYFVIALSLCPQGSQVSIGNSAMESWFCQRSNSRPPQAGRQHSGPSGKKQMDRKPTCFPKLFESKCSFAVAL